MPATTLTPAALDAAACQTPAPAQPVGVEARRGTDPQAPVPDFDARMKSVNDAMDDRLQMASLANDVNTAHIATDPLDLADVIRGPIDIPRTPVDLYPTPVANLLQRAHQRLIDDDWCSGALVNEQGARCLMGAIRIESGGSRSEETQGLDVLMDAIRKQFPGAESVPSFNDAWGNGRVPIRVLQQAADHADACGL
jgi:hypothetical protein